MKEDILKNIIVKRNSVELEVYGDYALFSDPVTRVGGEKFTYQVPTYQALKGILESVYWKPTFIWYIDSVRILNKIQTEGKGIRPIKLSGGNELAFYTYLKDVRYQVLAHFEWNENRLNLAQDRDENKHHNIAKRMLEKGGKRDIFLGTRECQGYVAPSKFGDGEGYYDDYGELNFGFIFHGFNYPDEIGGGKFGVRFFECKMQDGIIIFPPPNGEEIKYREIRDNVSVKAFNIDANMIIADAEEN
ncbi:MAG TPA: type I-C CRISPR-associated protein Cas5c [Eubacteriales bacterium]|jgi:CRISPR-associated protein Cas5d|nr:type I-C CRISPR-associated protein Cas5c [Eubacteriales bacterium]HRU84685.1 type I-C CRISPR-associated protein Cas5c [Eubacteriales bacterium]